MQAFVVKSDFMLANGGLNNEPPSGCVGMCSPLQGCQRRAPKTGWYLASLSCVVSTGESEGKRVLKSHDFGRGRLP